MVDASQTRVTLTVAAALGALCGRRRNRRRESAGAEEVRVSARVCLIEVSHWHAVFYYEQFRSQGIVVAGVSDHAAPAVERVARAIGGHAYTDYHAVLEREEPDFVFALGAHRDMAAIARDLLDRRLPLGMEKPLGLTSAEVAALAEQARRQGAFVAVPLTFRSPA